MKIKLKHELIFLQLVLNSILSIFMRNNHVHFDVNFNVEL